MNKIQGMPFCERPRERFKRLGPSVLRSDELLAVLLGSGSKKDPVLELSRKLIEKFGSIQGLSSATIEELQTISGIGLAKALKIKAAFELSMRSEIADQERVFYIKSPKDAFLVAQPVIKNEKREFFITLLLDVRDRLISIEIISIGILTATLVHPREVFFPAITRKAHAILAIHNHPSGHLEPSNEDISVTKQLLEVSRLMGIPLIDHLIISDNNYYSFKESGRLN